MESSWGFWSWLFYAWLPGIFIAIYLLKANCQPFENWWYNNVSIRFVGVAMGAIKESPGHGHSHDHGHGHEQGHSHSHGQGHGHDDELNKQLDDVKRTLFKDLNKIVSKSEELKKEGSIRILEIGSGRGANFKYFPEKCNLVALDAFDGYKKDLMENMQKFPGIHLEKFVHKPGENMEGIQDASVDVVIGTTVFCQVKDMKKVLSEIKRVLVPGGRFFYIEHIAAQPWTWTFFFQTLLTKSGIIPMLTQGHLDRHMDLDILKAGFSNVDQKYIDLQHGGSSWSWRSMLMRLAVRNVVGVATK